MPYCVFPRSDSIFWPTAAVFREAASFTTKNIFWRLVRKSLFCRSCWSACLRCQSRRETLKSFCHSSLPFRGCFSSKRSRFAEYSRVISREVYRNAVLHLVIRNWYVMPKYSAWKKLFSLFFSHYLSNFEPKFGWHSFVMRLRCSPASYAFPRNVICHPLMFTIFHETILVTTKTITLPFATTRAKLSPLPPFPIPPPFAENRKLFSSSTDLEEWLAIAIAGQKGARYSSF